jgi:hypothetical protein
MADGSDGATATLTGEPAAPAAPASPGTPPAEGGGVPASQEHWTTAIQDEEVRGWLQTKGYESQEAAARAHRNLEKLRGVPEDRLLQLPKDDDADAWGRVWDRLGRPETADGYNLPVPEGDDGAFAKKAAAWFHEAGVPKEAAQKLASQWNAYQAEVVSEHEMATTEADKQAMTELRRTWGNAFDQNTAIVDRAARTFGMSEDQILGLKAAMGAAGAMDFLYNVGMRLGEDTFTTGDGPDGFALTPEAAKARRAELLKDKDFQERWSKGEAKARREWSQISQAIASGNEPPTVPKTRKVPEPRRF